MAKPVYSTGDVPTADEVNQWFVNVLFARKTVAESVTSSTTLQSDDQLLASVEANAEYHVELFLIYGGAAAADLKVLLLVPTSGTFVGVGHILASGAASAEDTAAVPYQHNSSQIWGCLGSGSQVGSVHGVLQTAGTAGTFQVQWAQNTSNATATTVSANSYLKLTRVV